MNSPSKTYAISEIVGTSDTGISDAIENALATASKTLRNLDWFEMVSVRGAIVDGKVGQYQVTVKVGFRYDE
ncbi:MAG: dodecin family protein [Acidimicrobiia bacterium]|nr:dodecin family protein [Acidimicrobiia bacterium]